MTSIIPGFRGEVLSPQDPGYHNARAIWNGAIDRHPAIIARCTGAADVMASIRYAQGQGIPVSVRGGGHGVSGTALIDAGLVIDCSPMRGITVDPDNRIARAQSGVLWGEFDHETQAFGLATTGGIVTHTGIAGLTLGGGIGWLMRKYGTTVDNLVACEIITADAQRLRVSENQHQDLFWALRGGGGNFGVLTEFEYRLHEVGPTVLAGPIFWPMEDAPDVLRYYRDFCAEAPDELTTIVSLRRLLPLPAFPEQLQGMLVVGIMTCYAGSIDEGEDVLRPLRSFGKPLIDLIAPKPYVANQGMLDPGVMHGWHYYWKSTDLPELDDEMIDAIAANCLKMTSPLSYALIFGLGGAVARVPEDATAYSHRQALNNININAVWRAGDPDAEEHVAWARRFFSEMEPHGIGVYVNFLGDEGQDRVRSAYGAEKYARLVALKDRLDPNNFFRMNQNIAPTPR